MDSSRRSYSQRDTASRSSRDASSRSRSFDPTRQSSTGYNRGLSTRDVVPLNTGYQVWQNESVAGQRSSSSGYDRAYSTYDSSSSQSRSVIENIASPSQGERTDSSAVLRERNGRTAPGSEVLLTGRGALGGTREEAQTYLNNLSADQHRAYNNYVNRYTQLTRSGYSTEHAADIAADEHPTGREIYLEYHRIHDRSDETQRANAGLDAGVYLRQITDEQREAYHTYINRVYELTRSGYSNEHAVDLAADENPTGREIHLAYRRVYNQGRRERG
jgi:hypothetical protein